jgi:ribose/xylose/arabinose/galactoside ABC-type transport system permease subunit
MSQQSPPAPLDHRLLQRDAANFPPAMMRALSSILGPVIGLIVVVAIFGIWKPDRFLKTQTIVNALTENYHFAVAAAGATFVIITAGIDLSVGSTMALSCVCCAFAIRGVTFPERSAGTTIGLSVTIMLIVGICVASRMLQAGGKHGQAVRTSALAGGASGLVVAGLWLALGGRIVAPMSPVVGMVVGIVAGTLIGFLNGSLITCLGLPPFIVTLATLGAVRGLVLYITDRGTPISMPAGSAQYATMESFSALHYTDVLGLAPSVWLSLLVVALAVPLLHFTVLGRYAYAIGSNERTARLCGVNVYRYKTFCYMIAGATAGLAGVLMTAKFRSGQPATFQGDELKIIAAVVIGGTSLFGGEGTIIGTFLGLIMLGVLNSGCVIADIPTELQQIFIGGTIILAAALDRFRHLRG